MNWYRKQKEEAKMSLITALTVLYPGLLPDENQVVLELSELEVEALAHIRGIKKEKIMKVARIIDGKVILPVFSEMLLGDIEKLNKDIKSIKKAGGDRYSVLTLNQAINLLLKMVIVGIELIVSETPSGLITSETLLIKGNLLIREKAN